MQDHPVCSPKADRSARLPAVSCSGPAAGRRDPVCGRDHSFLPAPVRL